MGGAHPAEQRAGNFSSLRVRRNGRLGRIQGTVLAPIQSYFVRIRGNRVVVENLGNHEWVELESLDEVGPQIERWAGAAKRAGPVPLQAKRRARRSQDGRKAAG